MPVFRSRYRSRNPQQRHHPTGPGEPAPRARGERWLFGRHTVAAALANPERRWRRLAALAGHEDEAQRLAAGAVAERRGSGPAIEILDRDTFEALLPPAAVHQGLALEVEPLREPALAEVVRELETAAHRTVILALDQVSDPQNVGAILRSAAAFGARAVVVAAHGCPPITSALAKAASGAVDRVPLVRVINLARALASLKQSRFWICGLDESAEVRLSEIGLGERAVLVLGSEGKGLCRLVREECDYLARLPTTPEQPTLNVANAAAVALYEFARGIDPRFT